MAKFYDRITPELQTFIEAQHIFFVATAPNQGRVNLSPKGMDALRVINESEIAYLDLTGSGSETAAHLLENGRITVMLCSFTENPLILRLYGQGEPIRPRDQSWQEYLSLFTAIAGIASNPLFSLSNQAVKETQFLQAKAPNAKSVAVLPPSAQ